MPRNFGKIRPDRPIKNNGGTVIYGETLNGVVTQQFGAELLTTRENSSLEKKNSNRSLITKDTFINYLTGQYEESPYVETDIFIMHGGAFSAAFSNDFGI